MPRKLSPETALWARELWDKALEAPSGLRLFYKSRKDADIARFSLYQARRMDAELSKDLLPADDSMWGKSAYDCLRIRLLPADDSSHTILEIGRHADPAAIAVKVETF